ncbi:MAG: hypothetical protein LBP19_01830 [Treponema sp.]|jgi:hypothetical protein|nr:hypothetical protein [Treponema sp.]
MGIDNMDILINGQDAGITLEHEKTIGDLLIGIEHWLDGTGSHVSGIVLDDEPIQVEDIPIAWERELSALQSIDIRIFSWLNFAHEALISAKSALKASEDASFEEKKAVRSAFESGPAAAFLKEQMWDIAKSVASSLAGEGLSPTDTLKLLEERIREIEQPKQEILTCNALVSEIVSRLEDLPLDLQTGKDKRALETVHLFSHITEKLFRLLSFLKHHGFEVDAITIASLPLNRFIDDFNNALTELMEAFEAKDTVLTGDLAEYEMAPRLVSLYSTLKDTVSQKA